MRVWLIRHGMTRLGEEKRYQGSLDEGLSENGRRALTRAAFCPAHVYVSTAARARETAGIVFPEAEQLLCHDLREMDFGALEGRGWWEMEEEFTRRVCGCFEKILKAESGENGGEDNIAIVAHGGTQMALLGEKGFPQQEYYRWQRPCGCGWLLDCEKGSGRLRVIQEISFLR